MATAIFDSSQRLGSQTMHRILWTDDIVREIFTYLHPALNSPVMPPEEDTQTLFNCALVCKHFSLHALDGLWSVQYDLRPLLDLIPNTEITDFNYVDRGYGPEMMLNDTLQKEDLAVFERYSHRVKAYHQAGESYPIFIRMSALLEVLHCLGRQYLLPKLRIMSLEDQIRPNHYSLFNPSLKWLLFNPTMSAELPSLLSQISRSAPHLEHLGISQTPLSLDYFPILARFPSLKSLDTIGKIDITPESFTSTCPFADRLVSWKIGSIRAYPLVKAQIDLGWSIPKLSSLQRLEISDGETPPRLLSALANLALPNLRTFSFCLSLPWIFTELLALFSYLFGKKSSLRHLIVDTTRHTDTLDVNYLLQHAVPQDLENLEIRTPMFRALDASTMLIIGKVFPHLKKLTLVIPKNEELSFRNLAALAHHMPKLVHLGIGFGQGGMDSKIDTSSVPLCAHRLETLSISNTASGDPVVFARFIDRIFPFARASMSEDTCNSEMVAEVLKALEMMRECRRDERSRASY